MNLNEFKSGLPVQKPWLNINSFTVHATNLTADTGEIDEISSNLISLANEVSVPNAPINYTSLYSSGLGNISQIDQSGSVVTYVPTSGIGPASFTSWTSCNMYTVANTLTSLTSSSSNTRGTLVFPASSLTSPVQMRLTYNFDIKSSTADDSFFTMYLNGVQLAYISLASPVGPSPGTVYWDISFIW